MTTTATILIADDDPDARTIVSAALSAPEYTLIEAHDGKQAVERCKVVMPDLAVLDMMMPGLSGAQVCEWIKNHEGGQLVPVLILTARAEIQDKVTALEEGADDYLTKPFNYRELQARVKSLLRVRALNLSLQEKNRELAAAQEKLVAQERSLLAMQLAGGAAHTLGQPLTAMKLNIHLMEILPSEDERFKKALSAMKDDIERMHEIVKQMREVDASKTEAYYGADKILDIKDKSSS